MATQFINPYQKDIDRAQATLEERTRVFAENNKSFKTEAPTLYGNLQKTIAYYSPGGQGYQDALRDFNLGIGPQAQAGELSENALKAKELGITSQQLLTNPQLASDSEALARYKEVSPTQGISDQLSEIRLRAEQIKLGISTLSQAKEKGFQITPQTKVEEAQGFLDEKKVQEPKEKKEGFQFKSQIKAGGLNANISAPTSETPDKIDISSSVNEIIGASSGLTASTKLIQKQLEQIEKRVEEAQKKQEGLFEKFTNRKTISGEELRKNALKELGLPENFTQQTFAQIQGLTGEITALNQELVNLKNQEQIDLSKAEEAVVPMVFIHGEKALIQRQYAAKEAALSAQIGVKVANAQMLQGNMQIAERMIDKVIDLELFSIKQEREDLEFLFKHYDNYLTTLTNQEQNLLKELRGNLEQEENLMREDLRFKMKLFIDNKVPLLDTQSLSKMTDEEVARYVSQNRPLEPIAGGKFTDQELRKLEQAGLAVAPRQEQLDFLYGKEGGFTNTQLNKGASVAGLPLEEFQNLSYDVKNYFINSTNKEIEAMNEAIANIQNGKENPEDVKNEIDNSNSPPEVKAYLKSRIDAVIPTGGKTQNLWQAFWGGITRTLFGK